MADQLFKNGKRVYFYDRFGVKRSGKIVFVRDDGYLTLNMGGPHGTPQVIKQTDVVGKND